MFNSYLYVDDLLADSLAKSIEVCEKAPPETPEILFLFDQTLTMQNQNNIENTLAKFRQNPISIKGRVSILKGCLQNYNVSQNVKKLKLPMIAVHSKRNPLINVAHLDFLMKDYQQRGNSNIFEENKVQLDELFNFDYNRKALILERGGYNVYEVKNDFSIRI